MSDHPANRKKPPLLDYQSPAPRARRSADGLGKRVVAGVFFVLFSGELFYIAQLDGDRGAAMFVCVIGILFCLLVACGNID